MPSFPPFILPILRTLSTSHSIVLNMSYKYSWSQQLFANDIFLYLDNLDTLIQLVMKIFDTFNGMSGYKLNNFYCFPSMTMIGLANRIR
uniref:Uncharacterized protein n=1 Tax=Astyanax mexicanus TaxID=7994 RepID=A0A3B1IUJ2_ASTMX